MDYNLKISERVLIIIKENGIKREELAKLIDENKFKLDNYLQGKAKWDVNFIVKICNLFCLSFEDLIDTNYIPPINNMINKVKHTKVS